MDINKEYVYKAKKKSCDEWVFGYPIEHAGKTFMYVTDKNDYGNNMIFPQIDPATICKPLGMKDKQQNPIYTNDIIVSEDWWWGAGYISCVQQHLNHHDNVIQYITTNAKRNSYTNWNANEVIVVGNKFDSNSDYLLSKTYKELIKDEIPNYMEKYKDTSIDKFRDLGDIVLNCAQNILKLCVTKSKLNDGTEFSVTDTKKIDEILNMKKYLYSSDEVMCSCIDAVVDILEKEQLYTELSKNNKENMK